MSKNYNEYTMVEKPIIETLVKMGYKFVHQSQHEKLRGKENLVLFKPHLIDAVMRINKVDQATAESVFNTLQNENDNQKWVSYLRGNLSKKVPGEDTSKTIKLIDFDNLENNLFVCTNQLKIAGPKANRIPDVLVYVNGIPLVVIEAKSAHAQQTASDAIAQVQSAEDEIPRLFYSNLFNIATNDTNFFYGTTGAPTAFWFRWRDPWPRRRDEFDTEMSAGLFALLQPNRLLDILAHFIVFETDSKSGKVVKKVCRYQQFRAVNKMVDRVIEGKIKKGLIWHTQGSGKSLTMVFAVLKLKYHRGISSPNLKNPNILVVTDRKALDGQIARTFAACGLPNPKRAESIKDLKEKIASNSIGQTILGTIHKFAARVEGESTKDRFKDIERLAAEGSADWIVFVDECHRSQDQDLGAFLRATLPEATFFGFTGTPVKKGDLDTFRNFGPPGEGYLDKYGIDDAVRDGATVPIYYTSRMSKWHLEGKAVDILFDQWFAEETDEKIEDLKRRGVTKGDLARFPDRIETNAMDMWEHFRMNIMPDGFKAQIVAIDRSACVLYKDALDRQIATYIRKQVKKSSHEELRKIAGQMGFTVDDFTNFSPEELATQMSMPVFSPSQHDNKKHPELVPYHFDEPAEQQIISDFQNVDHPLKFLIVCNKYLTGFDAPNEQVMYLDSPLHDHNLLQAIARTNRRYEGKPHGCIVDYIGVSKSLDTALAAYRREDVASAMQDISVLTDELKTKHLEVMSSIKTKYDSAAREEVIAAVHEFEGEDDWYIFRNRAKYFLKAYGALSPDPITLAYSHDVKLIAAMIPYGRMKFEGVEETSYRDYSEKIRDMLDEHLEVTGLKTVCKVRNLTDKKFWTDFDSIEDLELVAVRKMAEVKKILREKMNENQAMYAKFSDRILKLIEEFQAGQMAAAEFMDLTKGELESLVEEDHAYEKTGMTKQAFGLWRILEAFPFQKDEEGDSEEKSEVTSTGGEGAPAPRDGDAKLSVLQQAASEIDALYASDTTAPTMWQKKEQLKKELRGQVRKIVFPLKLEDWQGVPAQVEKYALLQYEKL